MSIQDIYTFLGFVDQNLIRHDQIIEPLMSCFVPSFSILYHPIPILTCQTYMFHRWQRTVYPFFVDEMPFISIDPFFSNMVPMGGGSYIATRETIDDQMSLPKNIYIYIYTKLKHNVYLSSCFLGDLLLEGLFLPWKIMNLCNSWE